MVDEKKEDKEPVYTNLNLDLHGLSSCLAVEDWKEITKNVDTSDLNELIVSPVQGEDRTVEVVQQPKGKWASLFFDLKQSYVDLILSFCKEKE